MNRLLRTVFIILGIASLVLATSLCLRLAWTTSIWPWADSFLPYNFLGAFIAATGASLLWIGLSGELGTAVGGAINLFVFYAGLGISLFLLYQQGSVETFLLGTLWCAAGVVLSVGMLLWFRRYPIQDNRPMPLLVRISFVAFVVLLLVVGVALLFQVPNIFAWKLTPPSAALIGCFFIGASTYFLYGLWQPNWHKACGQLWAFLVYDLVLIIPYLQHFATVSPQRFPSLFVNTFVLVYSGALAVYYLLLKKETRTWRNSGRATPAHTRANPEKMISGSR